MRNNQRDHLCLHTLRTLALAAVQQAASNRLRFQKRALQQNEVKHENHALV